ncbi:hypothetical protein C3B48_05190 [Flavobacterium columnare]|uniref:hypothetical protein n=1 Tax=Flavobacterium columnare TaxID=996 RepID=UPI0018965782|nr:hypothetical protein [Flavobacterium columnare]MBF6655061.1 hypothetical protein [Flavobacterium columnare]
MKQLDLTFKIDEQFGNWEFDLDFLPQRVAGYFSFKYFGKELNVFLNIITHKTELIFNEDFLTAVIITINNANQSLLVYVNSELTDKAKKIIVFNKYKTKFKIFEIAYYTIYNPRKKQITVIYGKPRFIQKHLLLLH